MMSLPSPPSATSSPPLPSMTSLPAPPQNVSLSMPPKTRSAFGVPLYTDCPLIPDGSTVLIWRYWIVPSGLRSSSLFSSQLAWSGRRRPSRAGERANPAGVAVQVGQLELAVGGGERVGLQRVRAVGVALDQLGERVALELGAQVHAGRAGQVVQPVAVLQLLQLRLEDVVEGAAQQAAVQVGQLGEAADPQVDVVETGGGDAGCRCSPRRRC